MELFTSFRLLVFGVLKRIYWLAPALLSDPFDIAERWFKVMYVAPSWLVWVLVPLGLAIAITLTYHELRKQNVSSEQRIRSLSDAKPSIVVRVERYGCLQVENNGGEGKFTAKAQMIYKGQPKDFDWLIKWDSSLEIEQTILKGDRHLLEVASCEWTRILTSVGSYKNRPFIRFPRANREIRSEGIEEIHIWNRDLPPRFESVEIEVSIFSTPDMLSPF